MARWYMRIGLWGVWGVSLLCPLAAADSWSEDFSGGLGSWTFSDVNVSAGSSPTLAVSSLAGFLDIAETQGPYDGDWNSTTAAIRVYGVSNTAVFADVVYSGWLNVSPAGTTHDLGLLSNYTSPTSFYLAYVEMSSGNLVLAEGTAGGIVTRGTVALSGGVTPTTDLFMTLAVDPILGGVAVLVEDAGLNDLGVVSWVDPTPLSTGALGLYTQHDLALIQPDITWPLLASFDNLAALGHVPEPASFGLLALAGAAAVGWRRRRAV